MVRMSVSRDEEPTPVSATRRQEHGTANGRRSRMEPALVTFTAPIRRAHAIRIALAHAGLKRQPPATPTVSKPS